MSRRHTTPSPCARARALARHEKRIDAEGAIVSEIIVVSDGGAGIVGQVRSDGASVRKHVASALPLS